MRTTIRISALLTVIFSSGVLLADVIPPDVWECNKLNAGDECSSGRCQPSMCSRLDYDHWDRDASAAPPTTTYACLRCTAAGAPGIGGTGGVSGTITGSPGGAPPSASSASDDNSPTGACNCAMAKQAARTVGPWLLAAGLWVPWLRRRRQRAK